MNLVKTVQTRLSESLTIVRSYISKRNENQISPIKSALLYEAKQKNNLIAIKLLSFQKSINAIKYYGIRSYIHQNAYIPHYFQRLFSTISLRKNTLPKGKDDDDDDDDDDDVAKVAFMITSNQKKELIAMGYDLEQIKHMKPMDAVVILKFGIEPGNDSKVKEALEKMNEEAEMKKRMRERKLKAEEELTTNKAKTTVSSSISINSSSNDWFEVVEVNNIDDETKESSIALYRTEEEAKVCLEMKENTAKRDNRKCTFLIRAKAV